MKVSIVIPAYNEGRRIKSTLCAYEHFFQTFKQNTGLHYELIVVLNGCTDNTRAVVELLAAQFPIVILSLEQAGKGLAIKAGFLDALSRPNDYIGFVDADMATSPMAYHELIVHMEDYDGIIASRYMRGARVFPPRPLIKRLGSIIFYESLIKLLFHLPYTDFQCGAKLFSRKVIATVAPQLTIAQWAFDVELLYLCKKNGYRIKEYPTEWNDQKESKLRLCSGLRMLGSLIKIYIKHR